MARRSSPSCSSRSRPKPDVSLIIVKRDHAVHSRGRDAFSGSRLVSLKGSVVAWFVLCRGRLRPPQRRARRARSSTWSQVVPNLAGLFHRCRQTSRWARPLGRALPEPTFIAAASSGVDTKWACRSHVR
jgi:hypothetical protein